MKKSNILLIVSGYFSIVWYTLSLSNAFHGLSINSEFTMLHAIGAVLFLLMAALFTYAEDRT